MQSAIETNAKQLKTEVDNKWVSTKKNMEVKAENLVKKMPDTKRFHDYITAEGNELYNEIQNDPTLKHICDAV